MRDHTGELILGLNGNDCAIYPSSTEKSNIKEINGVYIILWMFTKTEKCSNKQQYSHIKSQNMLEKKNNIYFVICATIPQNVPIGKMQWIMNRSTNKTGWNVQCY